jgi:nucleoside-diphosphate-sugar epimerase
MAALAARTYATPFIDARETQGRLGVRPTPLITGLERTIAWMKEQGKI